LQEKVVLALMHSRWEDLWKLPAPRCIISSKALSAQHFNALSYMCFKNIELY
jgi:hypothetical protein